MLTITLYHTLGCHLCELAEAVLDDVRADGHAFDVEKIDISISEELVARYGIRIPVLLHPIKQTALDWPFDAERVEQWLTQ